MARPKKGEVPVSVRLDPLTRDRLDELLRMANARIWAGVKLSKTDALRAAIEAGLEALGVPKKVAPAAAPARGARDAVEPDPNLPGRMKAWREANGLTVREAGERVGISHATWARIERGDFAGRANTVDAIRRTLGA
jgi:DNA-binding XRE family transcriptional regulator